MIDHRSTRQPSRWHHGRIEPMCKYEARAQELTRLRHPKWFVKEQRDD